ncbi:efflux RND transporter periplasmic adaptor subunit [Pyxidicoccus sp. 3LG]
MEGRPSRFRKEALEYHARGVQEEGDVLRIAPAWTAWTFWLLVTLLVVALLCCVVGTLYEYASGPALVRVEGRTDLTVQEAGVVTSVAVQPGQHVEAGQVLVTFASDEEHGALERIRSEFDLQLVRFLRNPVDETARQALTSLRAEREQAEARMATRTLRARFAGVVGDVRIQPGQFLPAGTRVLSLTRGDPQLFLLAFLPGYYRPFLKQGMPLRVELDGFHYAYQTLTIDSVGDQIIGPTELRRYLGADLADAISLEGPIVLVKARLPSASFLSEGKVFNYFDGMPARAESRVRAESIMLVLFPGLKELFSDDD